MTRFRLSLLKTQGGRPRLELNGASLAAVCTAMGSIPKAPRQTSEACGDGSVGEVLATQM